MDRLSPDACPLCDGTDVYFFCDRPDIPVHQNVPVETAELARRVPKGQLRMGVCLHCGFVFNAAFDPKLMQYGSDYENTQVCSPVFRRHMDERVQRVLKGGRLRNARIVEIGCGNGSFLRRLVADGRLGNRGIGYDPSYVGEPSDLNERVSFVSAYFGAGQIDTPPDVVVCRHVIEHIENPMPVLETIRRALGSSSRVNVYFETPCVDWILENRVLWDLFYEHCSLFSAATLRYAFRKSNFSVSTVENVFDGQYLWIEADSSDSSARGISPVDRAAVERTVSAARKFASHEADEARTWTARLRALKAKGAVAIWGAGAKGVTFSNLFDPAADLLSAVVDLNPKKQGKYVPGTGIPIIAPQELDKRGIGNAILMNPNYKREVSETLSSLDSKCRLLDQ